MADKNDVDPGAQIPTPFFELTFSEDELLRALAAQIPEFARTATITLEGLGEVSGYTARIALRSGGEFTVKEEHWERAYTHLLPENLRDRYLPLNVHPSCEGESCGWTDECARTDDHFHVDYVLRVEFAATAEQRAQIWNWYDDPWHEQPERLFVERNCYGLMLLRDGPEPDPGICMQLVDWRGRDVAFTARETVSRLDWPPQDRAKVASIFQTARELRVARMADVEDPSEHEVKRYERDVKLLDLWLYWLTPHSGR